MRSPVRWLSDQQYAIAPVQEKALAWADSYVGERETGHNAGPFVTMLLKAIGLGPGFAWCAAFVGWCLIKAGFRGGPKFGRGAVRNWAKWARDSGKIRAVPKRGDLFFWLNDDGTGHIGFCLGLTPNLMGIRTIEGNTNEKGSREGDGVYKKERMPGKKLQYIRWWE